MFRHWNEEQGMQRLIRTRINISPWNKLIKGAVFIHLLIQKARKGKLYRCSLSCKLILHMQHFALTLTCKAELVIDELTAQTAHPAHKRWLVLAWQKVSDLSRLMQVSVQTHSIIPPCDLFCCLPWRCSQSKDLSVMMCGRTWIRMMKDSVQKLWATGPYKSYPIYSTFQEMILLWISEDNVQASISVLQLPCSLQHAGGKCRHTNALGIWLYASVLGKFLFSCLSFLFSLHRTWFLFLGVGDTNSESPGGTVTPCFHTPLLSFRVSCHKSVRGAYTLCATLRNPTNQTAFKPLPGTHRIVLSLSVPISWSAAAAEQWDSWSHPVTTNWIIFDTAGLL